MTTQHVNHSQALANFANESDKAIQLVRFRGLTVDMAEWLTITRYAQRYNTTAQIVTDWIACGVIPADCVMALPELNDLRLVKNQPYK
jgi:hypothetical protein